ncbi:glycosyltransferase family 2 protein [Phaeobacter sp.]|uniref:glycosyltransferase family 2 protein n=1 Tax=Phaeobacter sp. TaxID=1902409 RepID=UPI0025FE4248|nr:glycosyltransferase family 2 protein [Phaeobacter sp.]
MAPSTATVTKIAAKLNKTAGPDNSRLNTRVLLVVPTLNEQSTIKACLNSLMQDPKLQDRSEVMIVVADGGSTDATVAVVTSIAKDAACRIAVLDNTHRIQSAGINLAVETYGAEFDVLLRCDAHAVYPARFVTQLLQVWDAQDRPASVVVPMDSQGRTAFARAAAWVVDTPLGSGGSAHRGGRQSGYVDHGHHALMDLSWFRSVGGYDADFSHNEDAELDHRISGAGGRIWLAADVRLGYIMRDTAAGLWRQYFNYGKGRARMLLKHRARPRLRQMAPVLNLFLCCVSLCASLLWPIAAMWVAVYGAVLLIASLCGLLNLGRDGLWAGLAAGIMHMAWALGVLRIALIEWGKR